MKILTQIQKQLLTGGFYKPKEKNVTKLKKYLKTNEDEYGKHN